MAKGKKQFRWGALFVIVFVCTVVVGVSVVLVWSKRSSIERVIEKSTLPRASEYTQSPFPITSTATPTGAPNAKPTPVIIRGEANLAVPFTPQAPHANWDDPYKEFCEEASVLMAMKYITKEPMGSADDAEKELLAIKDFEDARFGFYKDTTAAETAVIFREYYKYDKVQLIKDPSIAHIQEAIGQGKVVLVPAAGRLLHNPYFQQPGPLYHMFVIKGYTAEGKFIVNDPGTRRGGDFLYDQSVVMNAMHDWRPDANIDKGEKVILVVG